MRVEWKLCEFKKRTICAWLFGCPRINGRSIECDECPCDNNNYTKEEAIEIIKNWEKKKLEGICD